MALVDGDNGMGHLVARYAMGLATDMAAESGLAWIGLQHSNHAGAAAVYASMALERDQIGVIGPVPECETDRFEPNRHQCFEFFFI